MLSYFRINDPYRLIIVFVLLFLFRLPLLISGDWHTIPELSWMIVGERMNEGALLYVGIWDDIGPLSAWSYRILDFMFGRSQLALQILGLLVFFIQVFYVNYLGLKHKLFNENNYLSALFYSILGLTFFNIITLSPQLMGMTFILLSLNGLFNHVESRNKTDGNLLNIGIFTGIAALFYLPYMLMVLVHVVGLISFTNTIGRRYLLLLYGITMPLAVCWIVYAWYGDTGELYSSFFQSLFELNAKDYLGIKTISILIGASTFIVVIAIAKTLLGFGFTVFQVRSQKVMFFASVFSLIIFLTYADKDGYSFIMLFPWGAFFMSHFFLSIRKAIIRELTFFLYVISIVTFYFGVCFNLLSIHDTLELDSLLIKQSGTQPQFASKKTLVVGPDIKPYFVSRQATPYFNWDISRRQLGQLDYYDNLQAIDKNLRNDMPDYIIDQVGLVPDLFEKLPLIAVEYVPMEGGLYKRLPVSN